MFLKNGQEEGGVGRIPGLLLVVVYRVDGLDALDAKAAAGI